jgi:hypothetical protein
MRRFIRSLARRLRCLTAEVAGAARSAFQTNEAELYNQLIRAARASISAHTEHEDNNNF